MQILVCKTGLCDTLNKFSLTEEGQVAIEEYEGKKYNTKLSVWALIIAGLSFLASVAAVIVACIVK